MDEKTEKVSRDAPLRLDVALKLAFPAGGLTVKGLRKEIEKGRLEVELIANKHFTTLAAIDRMRELCKVVKPSQTDVALCVRDIHPKIRDDRSESDLQRLARKIREELRAKTAKKKLHKVK
ncbi:hypothetical protein ACVME8_001906 [Bradyrhizobium diazoefficiens]